MRRNVEVSGCSVLFFGLRCKNFNLFLAKHQLHSLQDSVIFYFSAESSSNAKLVGNFEFSIFNNSKGISAYNLTFDVLRDFSRLLLYFELRVKSDNRSNDYDVRMFHGNVDFCNLTYGMVSNYVVKSILPGPTSLSNLRYQCPLKKGSYFIYNMEAPELKESVITIFVPIIYCQWEMKIIAKAKTSPTASAVRVFNFLVKGEALKST